jgi:hypothetical protein
VVLAVLLEKDEFDLKKQQIIPWWWKRLCVLPTHMRIGQNVRSKREQLNQSTYHIRWWAT